MVNNAQKPKQVSLSQVRHQMMKQKSNSTEAKVEASKPNIVRPAENTVVINQPNQPVPNHSKPKAKQQPVVQKQKVISEKKENFAARTMKGFMKLIGADKEATAEVSAQKVENAPIITRTSTKSPTPQKVISVGKKELDRTDSGDKSVLKMIQTRLKRKNSVEISEEEKAKAEKSAIYMDKFRVQGSRLLLSSQHLNLSSLLDLIFRSLEKYLTN